MIRKEYVFFIFLFLIGVTNAQNSLYFSSSQELFDKGYELFQGGKYNSSINVFEEYIEENPFENVELAKYYIAVSHLHLFHANGEQELVLFADENTSHYMASKAYFELGKYFYFNSKYDKAIQYFRDVEKDQLENSERGELNFKLAYSYFAKKEFKIAGGLFDQARLRNNKYQSASTYYVGYIFLEEKKWDKALSALKGLEEDKSYANVVPAMIAKALYNSGNLEELIKYGLSVFETKRKAKNKEQIALFVGSAYFDKKEYPNSITYLEEYKSKSKKIERVVSYRIGYAYYQEHEMQKAVNNLKNAMIPDDSLAQVCAYYLGASYQQLGEKKYAITAFKQASDLDFSKKIREEALYNYGRLSYEVGNNSNTIIGFSKLLKEFPNTGFGNEVREVLSDAYLKSDNYVDAINYLEAIRVKNDYIKRAYQNAAFMMAVKYYNCNDFENAELYLDKSFVYPIDKDLKVSSYYLRAEMLSKQGKTNLAILAYSGVFQTDTKRNSKYYLESRYGIAYQYYNHNEYKRARSHFQYYVENPPRKDNFYYDAKIRLADCYYIDKIYDKAEMYYEQVATESEYMNDYALFQSGVLNYLLKKPNDSKKFFAILAEKHPNSGYADNALFQTAIVDFETANYKQSVIEFGKLIKKYASSDLIPIALEKRGIAYTNIRKYDKAKSDFAEIIKSYTRHKVAKSAIYSLQETLNQLGQSSEFSGYLAKYKEANPEDTDIENVEYENAKNLFVAGKHQKAIDAFTAFISSYQNSSLIYDGRYYLAESYKKMKQFEKAFETYEKVIEENKSFYTARAIYKCADLYYKQELFAKANDKYAKLIKFSHKNKDRIKGYKGQMKCANALNSPEATILFAVKIIKSASVRAKDKNLAYLYKAKSELQLNNDSVALKDFKYVMNNSDFDDGAESNYLLAKYHYAKGNHTESIDLLHKLNEHYASYDYWLGKSFLLIADNYISTDELFQAKATLVSVKENSLTEEIVLEAEQKLMFLEQDEIETDTSSIKIINENELLPDSLKKRE